MAVVTEHPSARADAELLEPVLNERMALRGRHLAACLWFAVFFVYLSYIPLFHTDIWGHVHYGRWILDHGALPAQDPVMPLAEGMRVIDNAWLAQVAFAWVERQGGAAAMSALFALTVLAAHLIAARVFFRLSGSVAIALAGMGLSFLIGFSRHAIIRPEIFGGLMLAILFWLLLRVEPWRSRIVDRESQAATSGAPLWLWGAVPLLFALWANLHGSFVVGLIVLVCHAAGRGIDVVLKTRRPFAPLADRDFQRLVLLTELAVAAVLVNPYGLDLLISTARFGSNPNLRDVLEWRPLALIHLEGIAFSVSIALLLLLWRHSRAGVSGTDALLLLAFAASMAPAVRMIGWYAPVFAWVVAPHLADVWKRLVSALPPLPRLRPETAPAARKRPNFIFTLLGGLAVWVAFAVSPISQPVLGGKSRTKEMVYSRATPHAVTQYLHEKKPDGLVFGPQWWGDWLAWSGPPEMQMFMTTNLHLAPARVWRDYLQVARGQAGWEQTLDRYSVSTLVIHKELQPGLTRDVRRSLKWRIDFEDNLAIVAHRIP